MKKLLASIGIGSAKVDTIILDHEIEIGSNLTGEVHIIGGDIAQHISKIDLDLYTYIIKDDQKYSYRFAMMALSDAFVIEPHESRVIPFSLQVPYYTPISAGGSNQVWLETALDIDMALDPSDSDHLNIIPHSAMFDVFESLEELGFSMYKVDIEASTLFEWGFIQEFEFKPRSMRGNISEIEVIFVDHNDHLEVYLEKESKIGGIFGQFSDMMDLNERMYHFSIPTHGGKSQISKDDIKRYIESIL
jgi:sporulation-control protein